MSSNQFVVPWRFADKADGYMDEIHDLRDHYQADVAVLIVDDADGCGQATRVGADKDEAFAWLCPWQRVARHHELQGKLRRLPPRMRSGI
jgi:hypothetical protein